VYAVVQEPVITAFYLNIIGLSLLVVGSKIASFAIKKQKEIKFALKNQEETMLVFLPTRPHSSARS
jgi:hypothetical protein